MVLVDNQNALPRMRPVEKPTNLMENLLARNRALLLNSTHDDGNSRRRGQPVRKRSARAFGSPMNNSKINAASKSCEDCVNAALIARLEQNIALVQEQSSKRAAIFQTIACQKNGFFRETLPLQARGAPVLRHQKAQRRERVFLCGNGQMGPAGLRNPEHFQQIESGTYVSRSADRNRNAQVIARTNARPSLIRAECSPAGRNLQQSPAGRAAFHLANQFNQYAAHRAYRERRFSCFRI